MGPDQTVPKNGLIWVHTVCNALMLPKNVDERLDDKRRDG